MYCGHKGKNMSNTALPTETLAHRLGVPETFRWLDLSAYGMKLKLAVYRQGRMLVMEGGEKHADKMLALGFRKVGDEWAMSDTELFPRKYLSFMSILPDASIVRYMQAEKMVIDRSSSEMPGLAEASAVNALVEKIVAAAKKSREMPYIQLWIAEAVLGDHTVQALGTDPEHAMRSLVDIWSDHAALEGEDPELIVRFRDSVTVNPAQIGKGYAKGVADNLWYRGGYNGADARFDDILATVPENTPSQTRRL